MMRARLLASEPFSIIRVAKVWRSMCGDTRRIPAHFNFDVHNLTGAGLDETGCQKHFTQEKGYTIPYGCLVPEKTDGLLLSGRNISGTHLAHSNFRVMPICVGTGWAAGTAAAIAVRENISPRGVDVKEIQAAEARET